jgi:hypothetical protein
MKTDVEFRCPKCGALSNEHGDPKKDDCCQDADGPSCNGFLCECDDDGTELHGTTYAYPCPEANCYHCGWGGKFPKPPGKWPPWTKKAIEAGWKPPEGWQP